MPKKKLKHKFIKVFMTPLVFGIISSILITFILVFKMTSESIIDYGSVTVVENTEKDLNHAFIYAAKSLITKKIQVQINAVLQIKEHFNFIRKNNYLNLTKAREYANQFSVNAIGIHNKQSYFTNKTYTLGKFI